MKGVVTFCWVLFWFAVLGFVAWLLGLGDVLRESVATGRPLDWVMGGLCLLWLILILKAPWDLYFQAQRVAFEIQRSKERNIPIVAEREEYIRALRRRLGWLAVGAHVVSAALVAAITYYAQGKVGYFFTAFYLVSTVFRPAVAGYVYLWRKLTAIGEEVKYPREDIVEVREKLQWQEDAIRALTSQMEQCREELQQELQRREAETYELRQTTHALSREFERTVSRLTDTQEVIKGIQAFVRLVSQATHQ
jgi:hypothetical protein